MTTNQPSDPQGLRVLEHDVNAGGEFTLWMTRESGTDSIVGTYGHDCVWRFSHPLTGEEMVPTHRETVFAELSRHERTR